MIFRASDVGQFQEKTPIANLKLNEGREHHFTIKFGSRGASIFLDKKKIGMAEENILEKQVIGFRGGCSQLLSTTFSSNKSRVLLSIIHSVIPKTSPRQ
jgi:hypothetical protein